MKSFHSRLASIAPYVFIPALLLLKMKRKARYVCLIFFVFMLSGCFLNFYRTNTVSSVDADTAQRLSSEQKYFIVHFSNSVNGLENVYISHDSLYGKIVPITTQHIKYLHPDTASEKNKVSSKDKKTTLAEVHLYTTERLGVTDSVLATNLSSFNRMDVYELNKEATNKNHTWSIIGIVLTVTAIVGIIVVAASAASAEAAASSCNCPQVYMDNAFVSGLYSGAVYSTLERTDYLPLNTVPYDAKDISFKIANAKNEEQFINKVQLLQVNHSKDINVLADRHGNILGYQAPVSPSAAFINEKDDVKALLQKTDEQYYSFNNNANDKGFSDVRLIFNKPTNADKAKLIIHARNTYWSGLLHKEFISMFGDDFEKWRTKQEKSDPKELEQWQTEQALPLMVYIRTKEGWKFVDYYQLIGNTASRDMIMQLDTKNIEGDKTELKLETAFRFWDLDCAGIDFSRDEQISTKVIEPSEALKSDSTNEAQTLQISDKQYVHLVNDEYISFKYSIPVQSEGSTVSSYFLISGGYYHNLEKFTGKPDYNTLLQFKKEGAFDKFSREKYKQAQDVAAAVKRLN